MPRAKLFILRGASLLVIGASFAAGIASAAEMSDPAGARFIPVELWTGAAWDGVHELRMKRADLRFGKYGEKNISGPIAWTRPGAAGPIQVYVRMNRGKKQLFTLSSRGDGLGRVFDSRYRRDCVDEVKFPLGWWKDGETREYDISCNGETLRRKIKLTIEKLDFTYDGVPHSLQYHWVVDGGKAPETNMHYIYSPGRGLASLNEE